MVEPFLATTLNPDITPMARFLFGLIVYGPILLIVLSPFVLVIYRHFKVEPSPESESSAGGTNVAAERLPLLMVLLCLTPLLYGLSSGSLYGCPTQIEQDNFLLKLLAIFGPPMTVWGWPRPIKNKFSRTRVFLICFMAVCLYHWLCHLSWILAPELLR